MGGNVILFLASSCRCLSFFSWESVVVLALPVILTLSEAEAREGIALLNKTASQMEAQKAAAQ